MNSNERGLDALRNINPRAANRIFKMPQAMMPQAMMPQAMMPQAIQNISNSPGDLVTIQLRNGLGNRIFQVLAAKAYAEKYNKQVVLCKRLYLEGNKPHEQNNDSSLLRIFPYLKYVSSFSNYTIIQETTYFNYNILPNYISNVLLIGYFQCPEYFPSKIPNIKTSYYENTYFIHIRGGDYLQHPNEWGIDIVSYYKKCFDQIDSSIKYIVFSNDNIYTQSIMKNFNVTYTISDKSDPVDTLIEMANCAGGICVNSTFGWLGALFQGDRRGKIFMPSIWNKMRNCNGIYPDWATIINLDSLSKQSQIIPDIYCKNESSIIWITFINEGYINFTKNFLESMKHNNCIFSLIIYCSDESSMGAFKEYSNVICIDAKGFLKYDMSKSLTNWLSINYKRLVFAKLDAIKYTLSQYTNSYVGYIDTDIILFKNPTLTIMNIFQSNPDTVFVSQCDENLSQCSNFNNCPHFCSGVIVFKNIESVNKLLEYNDNDVNNLTSDQEHLLNIANKYNIKHITVDKNIFLNGVYPGVNTYNIPLILPKSVDLIHYNYLIGDNKMKLMKKNNMWFI